MIRPFPFELEPTELNSHLDDMVDSVWDTLQSDFLTLPKGSGFLPYEKFAAAYYVLHRATSGFRVFSIYSIWSAFEEDPIVFVVVRTILGLQPPEWAYLTSENGTSVSQGQARTIDRTVRESEPRLTNKTLMMVKAMFETAVALLEKPPQNTPGMVHRLDKIDTAQGIESLRHFAELGIPYPGLLYERFLGRPFASHRDAVSDIIGDTMELAVEQVLSSNGVVFRKTRRAERVPGLAQAPDFIVPDETHPRVLIEVKITQDDGTARDKVARILRLRQMSDELFASGGVGFQVVACIDGRGFGQRRQDMKDMLIATSGKVFTSATLTKLVDHTDLALFRTRQ